MNNKMKMNTLTNTSSKKKGGTKKQRVNLASSRRIRNLFAKKKYNQYIDELTVAQDLEMDTEKSIDPSVKQKVYTMKNH